MKNLIQMSLIFSSLIFAYSLLAIAFMLASQALVSVLFASPDDYFPVIVLVSGGLAFVTFAVFRRRIWSSLREIWSQLLRNL